MKKTAKSAPLSVWRPVNIDQFILGVPHYPEHVSRDLWENDAKRMAEAGFNTVRMGEFAWHIWEPYQGHFDFSLFDDAIAVLGRYGIKTILCTPTATPPRWLTVAHPEVLRADEQGRRAIHGSRQHADTTSPVLRDHSRRITRAMAEHYQDDPNVIGWQTDNELNTTTSISFSESCAIEFRKWCHLRYGDIAALNTAWGGDFWATHYDSFEQIELPLPMAPGYVSPGHRQDYHRFLAAATAAFQKDQIEILRSIKTGWFIYHNLGHLDDIDLRGNFGEDLDFLGYDVYPMLHDEMQRNGGHAYTQALALDWFRAFGGNFIVPEQASGLGSQPTFATMTPEPGEMRRMALTSVARGADGLMFFRWRPAHFGAEIYWMGLIDHDNEPRRRFAEAKHFAEDIEAIKTELLGTHVRMDVGIAAADFDNQESYKTYPMGLPSPREDGILLHKVLYERNIAAGFIHPSDDLSKLKALYVPHFMMWNDAWTENLRRFVENGGLLIVSAMTGTRTVDNHIHEKLAPGNGLSELLGIKVEEFGRMTGPGADGLFEPPGRADGFGPAATGRVPACSAGRRYNLRFGNKEYQAGHLYERLMLEDDVETLAEWSTRFLAGEPVLTARKLGQGQASYLGTYLTEALAERLADTICEVADVAPILSVETPEVEISERSGDDGRKMIFVINTGSEKVKIELDGTYSDRLTDRHIRGTLELEGYGAAILSPGNEL
ncbi:beta-galactosidase [Martelella sp. HB161492]|uniref:beta-galactosidase n=1 Tax=Martelella sp. HB161492 TaxID=2720726 RepID=UPI0015920D77|nr:beta-galactosidase [Martelella sp. HB161492]